ncbi:MAG TPA: DsbA family oxidoreductase [Acidimicrobiales bacterium]|nr:DsbA family oxidoreductase [Acidimicrobiales bacterium]
MQIEIWSDVVCPWCYIGKRRFEEALASFAHGDEVSVVWRSFELDPRAPRERQGDYASRLAKKYGMSGDRAMATLHHMTDVAAEEGLEFDFARTRAGNTFDAHRVLHLAAERGVQGAVKERLLRAYFTEGEPIGDPDTLVRLAGEAGLDEGEVKDVLSGDAFGAHVRADEAAAEELDVTGVPFFLVDRRFAVAGAQSTDVFVRVLERAWEKSHTAIEVVAGPADGEVCDDGSCPV